MVRPTDRFVFALFLAVSLATIGVVMAGRQSDRSAEQAVILYFPPGAPVALDAFRGKPRRERRKAAVAVLRYLADTRQHPLLENLRRRAATGEVHAVRPLWLANGVALRATPQVLARLTARFPEVQVLEDLPVTLPVNEFASGGSAGADPDMWGLNMVTAPGLWNLGYRGQGASVGILDSGVDAIHPDLAETRYLGPDSGWCDVSAWQPGDATACGDSTPNDVGYEAGHGTGVMGLLTGGDTTGTPVGMAPDAYWLAVRVFDQDGNASLSQVILGLQWLLAHPHSPDVINMSWGVGQVDVGNACNLAAYQPLREVVQNLKSAGVFLVAGSGNNSAATLPAAYKEVFAVGAVNPQGYLWEQSGRGFTTCEGRGLLPGLRPYPNAVAPGDGVVTTDFSSGGQSAYRSVVGTSFSAPHAAGAALLLLSAFPDLTPDELELALSYAAAQGGGQQAVDNEYGYGIIDTLAAYDMLTQGYPNPLSPYQPLAARQPRPPAARVALGPSGGFTVSWQAAPDTGGGVTYTVYRDGIQVGPAAITGTSYTDATANQAATPVYTVVAVNGADPARKSTPATAFFGNVSVHTGDTRGRVDGFDLVRLRAAMGTDSTSPGWDPAYDLDGNNAVNANDLDHLLTRYGLTVILP